ncbi:MAG: hypothetical protein ACREQA_08175, partial [Candidatus Binatia bacterium]
MRPSITPVNALMPKGLLFSRTIGLLFLLLPSIYPSQTLASSHKAESLLLSNGLRVVAKKDP